MRPRRPRPTLDLCDPGTVRAVSRRAGLHPQHSLGQNFLIDRGVLEAIIAALAPSPADDVLEVGTGIGTLTAALAARVRHVVSVDIDPSSMRAARITLRHLDNVELIEADALACDPAALGLRRGWLAAANVPYQMTGALLNHLFEAAEPPARGVFLVQREVAQRLAAEAGDWSLATVAIRTLARVEKLLDVAPSSFVPAPAVHSSLIRLLADPGMPAAERRLVLELARAAFQLRRKTLRHGITRAVGGDDAAAAGMLASTGIDASRRPGTLTIDEWRALACAVPTSAPSAAWSPPAAGRAASHWRP